MNESTREKQAHIQHQGEWLIDIPDTGGYYLWAFLFKV